MQLGTLAVEDTVPMLYGTLKEVIQVVNFMKESQKRCTVFKNDAKISVVGIFLDLGDYKSGWVGLPKTDLLRATAVEGKGQTDLEMRNREQKQMQEEKKR